MRLVIYNSGAPGMYSDLKGQLATITPLPERQSRTSYHEYPEAQRLIKDKYRIFKLKSETKRNARFGHHPTFSRPAVILSCDDLLKRYHLLKTISYGLKCVSFPLIIIFVFLFYHSRACI